MEIIEKFFEPGQHKDIVTEGDKPKEESDNGSPKGELEFFGSDEEIQPKNPGLFTFETI